jgi:hypothetical protein
MTSFCLLVWICLEPSASSTAHWPTRSETICRSRSKLNGTLEPAELISAADLHVFFVVWVLTSVNQSRSSQLLEGLATWIMVLPGLSGIFVLRIRRDCIFRVRIYVPSWSRLSGGWVLSLLDGLGYSSGLPGPRTSSSTVEVYCLSILGWGNMNWISYDLKSRDSSL